MPKVVFLPSQKEIEVNPQTKILAAANRSKTPIRYGCAACQCGTCAVAVSGPGQLSTAEDRELAMLKKLGLATDGTARLACQARIVDGTVTVDIDFQDTYDPGTIDSSS